MFGIIEFLIVSITLPTGICALLARVDGRNGNRQLAKRVFAVASLFTLASLLLFMIMLLHFVRQPRPAGVQFGVSWFSLTIGHVLIFASASMLGSVGYLVSYRTFQNSSPEATYGRDAPMQRVDETGNPYQPPST